MIQYHSAKSKNLESGSKPQLKNTIKMIPMGNFVTLPVEGVSAYVLIDWSC
jgi:hypothetical protein